MTAATYPRWGLSVDQIAAIGSVCVSWGALDFHVGQFAAYLLNSNPHIVGGSIALNDRVRLIRALAHDCVADRDAFATIDLILTYIETDLRDERNRVVHDLWLSGGNQRVRLKPKFTKKPREPRRMAVFHQSIVQKEEVASLALLITSVANTFAIAAVAYLRAPDLAPASWPRIFARPLRNLAHRYPRNRSAQKAPPESSPE